MDEKAKQNIKSTLYSVERSMKKIPAKMTDLENALKVRCIFIYIPYFSLYFWYFTNIMRSKFQSSLVNFLYAQKLTFRKLQNSYCFHALSNPFLGGISLCAPFLTFVDFITCIKFIIDFFLLIYIALEYFHSYGMKTVFED